MRYALIPMLLLATPAMAGSNNIFNSQGQYLGSYDTYGNTTNGALFNSSGQLEAMTMQNGNSTAVFDSQGNYAGSVINNQVMPVD